MWGTQTYKLENDATCQDATVVIYQEATTSLDARWSEKVCRIERGRLRFFTSQQLKKWLMANAAITEQLRCHNQIGNKIASWRYFGRPQARFDNRLCLKHGDRSIHIERACELHGAKMTRQGLLHKGFNISLQSLIGNVQFVHRIFCPYKNNLT